ncbi:MULTISPECIES: FGGY-family carbohydrate kinase [Actinopolyspora]|uniref:Xylulokinase n=1 Tax=Actinopolyspora saharensis TaxID=995062 RepID=A0A1H1FK23_9ACTN|nr:MULTISPECIES: FGGY-family carbohydrate kinase [Actinopolyspora]NHD18843.1 carbohydrate kinase [Actinopolyspora sp. BKK2]NHE77266.1 carbohydrate kinase [Actinopolyspora sp. BKK1]SDR00806.1 xylulokinase [Actinopolyspora saharensis]
MITAVDIGTSLTKAAAFDDGGRVLAEASRHSHLEYYADGRVEQDLDDVVSTVAAVVREVVERTGTRPRAVALTGQGDGLWLRDAGGRPVRSPISWMDGRAAPIVRRWQRDGVSRRVYERTGNGLFPGSHGALLAHLAEHEPESLRAADVAGYCVDSVLHVLTGEISVDASDASVPFLDADTRCYDDAALEACGVAEHKHLLPKPAKPREVFELDSNGAELLGLPAGTPVTAGPFDLPACAVGGGLNEFGDGLLTVGTTLACQVLTEVGNRRWQDEPSGMWLCTPEENQLLHGMPAMVGTASLDWVLELLGLGIDDLGAQLEASPPGANDVSALPFLAPGGERSPFVDPGASGQLSGVRIGTTRADVVRAVCESVAYAARHCFEAAGLDGKLVACGGGTRSHPWAQVFADVLGQPLHLPDDPGMGARGAAVTAARALGDPVDSGEWTLPTREVTPNPQVRQCYEDGYRRYRRTLASMRELWRSD